MILRKETETILHNVLNSIPIKNIRMNDTP